jgi:hypothetical protein
MKMTEERFRKAQHFSVLKKYTVIPASKTKLR